MKNAETMSMVNPSTDDLLKKVDSRYTLVVLAAKRARQILVGSRVLSEEQSTKDVTNALEEILEGKIYYDVANDNDKSDDIDLTMFAMEDLGSGAASDDTAAKADDMTTGAEYKGDEAGDETTVDDENGDDYDEDVADFVIDAPRAHRGGADNIEGDEDVDEGIEAEDEDA